MILCINANETTDESTTKKGKPKEGSSESLLEDTGMQEVFQAHHNERPTPSKNLCYNNHESDISV